MVDPPKKSPKKENHNSRWKTGTLEFGAPCMQISKPSKNDKAE